VEDSFKIVKQDELSEHVGIFVKNSKASRDFSAIKRHFCLAKLLNINIFIIKLIYFRLIKQENWIKILKK
jgi:hypothetical protein